MQYNNLIILILNNIECICIFMLCFIYCIMKADKTINVDGQTYGERELAQLIRRKMITRTVKDKTKYTRKVKHKKSLI